MCSGAISNSSLQVRYRRPIRVDVSICCHHLPSLKLWIQKRSVYLLWTFLRPKSKKRRAQTLPLHPCISVALWVSIWPESQQTAASLQAGLGILVTGCKGVVRGTLAEAHRNLPSKTEHRCWARQGGVLPFKGTRHKDSPLIIRKKKKS